MQIKISAPLRKKLKKLKKLDPKLSKRIEKQLSLFADNPKHTSLRLHKLSGELKNLWSISISKDIRMIYVIEEDTAYFTVLGTHDEAYRKQ
ncbi:MAG: hypothetical protein UT63_C0025G0003 [Candidatus Gottesmanbacteria bacterium GW2011_GWC2_39_8]|uniref:Plasmid stabilization system n=1 Tax=Candidatus Gottesmanbacteria bacterium GW2011_GWC2_39_8 TaxID=1618450 RepID=A0A0G0Q6Q5_9BACT|nr:MAG: hypothetical protein UT63_C0025G0003 [Candidatus Gottesmanbacteria bacterium GW2011_GWC2_39_8]